MTKVIELSVKDTQGKEFVMLARNTTELDILVTDIELSKAVQVNNVLILNQLGEFAGFVEDALITLTFLDPDTIEHRTCLDSEPKYALL